MTVKVNDCKSRGGMSHIYVTLRVHGADNQMTLHDEKEEFTGSNKCIWPWEGYLKYHHPFICKICINLQVCHEYWGL